MALRRNGASAFRCRAVRRRPRPPPVLPASPAAGLAVGGEAFSSPATAAARREKIPQAGETAAGRGRNAGQSPTARSLELSVLQIFDPGFLDGVHPGSPPNAAGCEDRIPLS